MGTTGQIVTSRRLLVYFVLAAIVGGHAFCVVNRSDTWPFSYYPMYSRVYDERWADYEFAAVVRDGSQERELTITKHALPRPVSVTVSFDRLVSGVQRGERDAAEFEPVLHWVARTYQGGHGEPVGALQAVHAYRTHWQLSRTASGIEVSSLERERVASLVLGEDEP